jgi:transcription elongation factor Elf1
VRVDLDLWIESAASSLRLVDSGLILKALGDKVPKKTLDKAKPSHLEDWHGNNIAFNCPVCGKVTVVSGLVDKNGRECQNCHKSKGFVDVHGTTASIQWDVQSSLFWRPE